MEVLISESVAAVALTTPFKVESPITPAAAVTSFGIPLDSEVQPVTVPVV